MNTQGCKLLWSHKKQLPNEKTKFDPATTENVQAHLSLWPIQELPTTPKGINFILTYMKLPRCLHWVENHVGNN